MVLGMGTKGKGRRMTSSELDWVHECQNTENKHHQPASWLHLIHEENHLSNLKLGIREFILTKEISPILVCFLEHRKLLKMFAYLHRDKHCP